jgi:hypothetical protein
MGSSKIFLKNHKIRKVKIYTKAFLHRANSSFFISWSPGVRWGHNRETHFCMCLYLKKKIVKKSSPETNRPISFKLDTNHPCMKGIQIFQIKGQFLFKGEIITKVQK